MMHGQRFEMRRDPFCLFVWRILIAHSPIPRELDAFNLKDRDSVSH
jgi:hypothetical protein